MLAVLARVEGPVGGDPVHGQQGAVQEHERLGRRAVEGLLKRGNQRGQEVHGLADVAVDRGHAYAEGGREPGVGVTAAQMGQDEQGLPIRGRRRRRVPTFRRRSASCPVRKPKCELAYQELHAFVRPGCSPPHRSRRQVG